MCRPIAVVIEILPGSAQPGVRVRVAGGVRGELMPPDPPLIHELRRRWRVAALEHRPDQRQRTGGPARATRVATPAWRLWRFVEHRQPATSRLDAMQHLVEHLGAHAVRVAGGDEDRPGSAGKEVRRKEGTASGAACSELAHEEAHVLVGVGPVQQVWVDPAEREVSEANLRKAIAFHVDAVRVALADERDVVPDIKGPEEDHARAVTTTHDGR